MIMATGDNIITAICVSRECNLIKQDKEMISCEIENVNGLDKLKWEKLEDEINDYMNLGQDKSRKELLDIGDQPGNNEKMPLAKHLIDKTSNTLYDLYPPENINSAEFKREPAYKKKLNKIDKKKFLNDDGKILFVYPNHFRKKVKNHLYLN